MNRKHSYVASLLLVLALVGGLGACGGSPETATQPTQDSQTVETATISRIKLYGSVRELAADSALIIIATPQSQVVTADIDGLIDFTLATVRIDQVIKGPAGVKTGSLIVVRQTGAYERTGLEKEPNLPQAPPVPLLEMGARYLLYLTPSGLDGDKASQFYITGANAGLYKAADDRNYRQVQRQQDENLPTSMAAEDAQGDQQ